MKRRRSRRGGVFASAVLLLTACSSGGDVATGAGPVDAQPATPVVTTAPAQAPATPTPTPAPVAEPSPTALAIPQATPTPEPTATVEPAVAPTAEAELSSTAPPSNPAPTTAPTSLPVSGSQTVLAANGAEVYTLNCARCHAENGLGTAQYSASLIGVGSRYSTQGMISELTTGHPVTFGFAGKLSEEEIASVVAYVKAAFP